MTQTAAQAMVAATARLRESGVQDPARDARILLAHAARVEASRVTLIAPDDLEEEVAVRYTQLIKLRSQRVPVSHLIGEREFYGRRFKVSGDVLDPRPETETLIEAALAQPFKRVLDLGTGSGCIVITLLSEQPDALGVAVDMSEAACLQAASNAVLHNVDTCLNVKQSNWFSNVTGAFDLIVSNPPYITISEMAHLADEVVHYEPHLALTDGGDGLAAYRAICEHVQEHLASGGRLLVEIGPTQGRVVSGFFSEIGLVDVQIVQDLDGRDRVVMGRKEA